MPILEVLVARRPRSAVAEHNLAAALGDAGWAEESRAAAERAVSKGGTAPETWLVLGRALIAEGRLDAAEAAFAQALRIRPACAEAASDLVQLVWMRHGASDRFATALEPLVQAAAVSPSAAVVLARALRTARGDESALSVLARWTAGPTPDPGAVLAAVGPALDVNPPHALALAQTARRILGDQGDAVVAQACAQLACDRPTIAADLLMAHLRRQPGDCVARATLDAAWRMNKDPRAMDAEGYARLVSVQTLDLDQGDRSDGLTVIAGRLRALHPFSAAPFGQSIRAGAQSRCDPRLVGDPVLDQLFFRFANAVNVHVRMTLPRDTDLGWRFAGAWSVQLRAGGRHVDHVHPASWLSSAFYVALPEAVGGEPRAGWLRFGAAPIGAGRTLPALHWVQPRPGNLVLFPSWFWHGTEPFSTKGERLTIAFNLLQGR